MVLLNGLLAGVRACGQSPARPECRVPTESETVSGSLGSREVSNTQTTPLHRQTQGADTRTKAQPF